VGTTTSQWSSRAKHRVEQVPSGTFEDVKSGRVPRLGDFVGAGRCAEARGGRSVLTRRDCDEVRSGIGPDGRVVRRDVWYGFGHYACGLSFSVCAHQESLAETCQPY
jgi:hypothetical protein